MKVSRASIDAIDLAAPAFGNPPFGVIECLKASTSRFLEQAAREIAEKSAKKTKHNWVNTTASPLTMRFQVMCDCLALLRDGMRRGDRFLIVDGTQKFVQDSVIDIFKKSELKSTSFNDGKFNTKVKDWSKGSTRYGNGTQTNNIAADASGLRMRQLLESMQNAAEARLSRGARLPAAALDAQPHSNMSNDDMRELFGTQPPTAQQAGTHEFSFSHIHQPVSNGIENNSEWTKNAAAASSNEGDDAHRLTTVPSAEPFRPSLTAGLGTNVLGGDDDSHAAGKAYSAVAVAAFAACDAAAGTIRMANGTVQWATANFRRNKGAARKPPARASWAAPRVSNGTPAADGDK
jgi:hypothetical protein